MEPLRDPRRQTMDWKGWKDLRAQAPKDGEVCVLRINEHTGGLCPREVIREITAVFHLRPEINGSCWADREGQRLGWNGFIPNLLGWRSATAVEIWRWRQ